MSVQNQTVKNVYVGNGSTTVFPFTFALNVDDGEYVGVYVTNADGVSEPTTNFLIDTNAQTVTYPKTGDPLETGKKITLRREIPNEQELNLENLGPFFAEDVEAELDRIVMMIQQIAEVNGRAITTDMASDETPQEFKDRLLASSEAAAASAEAAAISATNAARSERNAATSEANAATSEANAAASESSASASANAAAEKVQEGQTILAGTAEYARQAAQDAAGIHEAAIPAWDAETVYSYPTVVAYTDGHNYRCIGQDVTAGTLPSTSPEWVLITNINGDDFFEIDMFGNLQPRVDPSYSASWELDDDDNIQPRGLEEEMTIAATNRAEAAALEAVAAAEAAAASEAVAKDAEDHIVPIVEAATLLELDADDNITTKESESD